MSFSYIAVRCLLYVLGPNVAGRAFCARGRYVGVDFEVCVFEISVVGLSCEGRTVCQLILNDCYYV